MEIRRPALCPWPFLCTSRKNETWDRSWADRRGVEFWYITDYTKGDQIDQNVAWFSSVLEYVPKYLIYSRNSRHRVIHAFNIVQYLKNYRYNQIYLRKIVSSHKSRTLNLDTKFWLKKCVNYASKYGITLHFLLLMQLSKQWLLSFRPNLACLSHLQRSSSLRQAIQYIRSYSSCWRPPPAPTNEEAPCRGDMDPVSNKWFVDGTDRVSRNVDKQLPTYAV